MSRKEGGGNGTLKIPDGNGNQLNRLTSAINSSRMLQISPVRGRAMQVGETKYSSTKSGIDAEHAQKVATGPKLNACKDIMNDMRKRERDNDDQ